MVYKRKKVICDLKQSTSAWFDNFSNVIARYGLRWRSSDRFIFLRDSFIDTIILAIYVGDIVVTGHDHLGIIQLKTYLSSHFHIKNLGLLRFLRLKVARSLKGLFRLNKSNLPIC